MKKKKDFQICTQRNYFSKARESIWDMNRTGQDFCLFDIYIMQSCLPTTIYVQNLSFLVSQISTSHNFFFYLADLHDIYGWWRTNVKLFDPHKKKGILKDHQDNLSQLYPLPTKILKKSYFFKKFTLYVPLLPFLHFFVKNRWILHIFIHLC